MLTETAIFQKVDEFAEDKLIGNDPALSYALKNSAKNGLPPISVSATQGKFLMMQAKLIGAKRILEVGTLGGYSSIWLARSLPADGKLISCEFNPAFADVARDNIRNANVSAQVDIRTGPALDTIVTLDDNFDFVFIDADKNNSPVYLTEAIKRTRKGAIIVVDNTVQNAQRFLDPTEDSPNVIGNRQVYDLLQKHEAAGDLIATHQQCATGKGSDAFVYAIRT
ncbi:family 3 O-methyltransferase [Wallemia mellicola]|uniref:Family 3 O-methyltransferase n=1 Tax=Wallemia mellicola TaxID=1708541 RepID=A0A4T0PTF3_9BASI|nr:family 3 O-methyltransferase [Wallemia mellicola]TIB93184.1 family 3 O-methyltransferase [Wallemia mellicola]TIB99592.1 family 3 O-methyltransferase [Wallemia mellicola]TIC12877.1 family 3 O-methyltransferase [Wallemia mellicola]TIC14576.1 family 3 O-methyltransferase [Wallemia mellicola]